MKGPACNGAGDTTNNGRNVDSRGRGRGTGSGVGGVNVDEWEVRCVCDGEGKVLRVYFRLHVQHPQPTHTAHVNSSLREPDTSCLCVQTADTERDECDCSQLSSSRGI